MPGNLAPLPPVVEPNPFEGPLDLGNDLPQMDVVLEPDNPMPETTPASEELALPSLSEVNVPVIDLQNVDFMVDNFPISDSGKNHAP